MIKIRGIYTIRDTAQPHYWDIVFEWEDQLSVTLGVPLIFIGKKYNQIYKPNALKKILNKVNLFQLLDRLFFHPSEYYVAFHIGPPGTYSFHSRNNVIPIIIDFWKYENLQRLQSVFKISKYLFVTSREVFDYLKEEGVKLNVKLLSLSLPDKYVGMPDLPTRDIDVIQIGRSNATFNEYMNKLQKEHPDLHYVFAERIEGEVQIISNKHLRMGLFKKREDFISLLRRSKISLVSAPGLDEDRIRTGGFSPVTPRFLESAACGCKLIGIYPDNADFDFYHIKEICPSVKDYPHFKELVNECLAKQHNPDYSRFLKSHLTSKRAEEMLNQFQN